MSRLAACVTDRRPTLAAVDLLAKPPGPHKAAATGPPGPGREGRVPEGLHEVRWERENVAVAAVEPLSAAWLSAPLAAAAGRRDDTRPAAGHTKLQPQLHMATDSVTHGGRKDDTHCRSGTEWRRRRKE